MDYFLTGKGQTSVFYRSYKCYISLNVTKVLGKQLIAEQHVVCSTEKKKSKKTTNQPIKKKPHKQTKRTSCTTNQPTNKQKLTKQQQTKKKPTQKPNSATSLSDICYGPFLLVDYV